LGRKRKRSYINRFGLTIDSGEKESWGQLGWNASTTEWGGSYITQVAIGQQINALGQQLNIALNNVTEVITVDAFPQGIQLTTNLGTVDPAPDVMLTGIGLTASCWNSMMPIMNKVGVEMLGEQKFGVLRVFGIL
jgi:hypothetical protein